MSRNRIILFLGLFLFVLLLLNCNAKRTYAIGDENMQAIIIVNGRNIETANSETLAIEIPEDRIITYEVDYILRVPVTFESVQFILIESGIEVFTHTEEINQHMDPGSDHYGPETVDLKPYIKRYGIDLGSGVHKLKARVNYRVESLPTSADIYQMQEEYTIFFEQPFFVKLAGNPVASVQGAVALLGALGTSLSVFFAVMNISRGSYQAGKAAKSMYDVKRAARLEELITGTLPSGVSMIPTDLLRNFVSGTVSEEIQKKFNTRLLTGVKSRFREKEMFCPNCTAKWKKGTKLCDFCGLTIQEAVNKYLESFKTITASAASEIASERIITVDKIARRLHIEKDLAGDVGAVLFDVGFIDVDPRPLISTFGFVRSGASLGGTIVVWSSLLGLKTMDPEFVVGAIVLGAIIPALIAFFIKDRLRAMFSQIKEKGTRE